MKRFACALACALASGIGSAIPHGAARAASSLEPGELVVLSQPVSAHHAKLFRLDPQSGELERFFRGPKGWTLSGAAVEADGRVLSIATHGGGARPEGTLLRIDPATGIAAELGDLGDVDSHLGGPAVGPDGLIWVAANLYPSGSCGDQPYLGPGFSICALLPGPLPTLLDLDPVSGRAVDLDGHYLPESPEVAGVSADGVALVGGLAEYPVGSWLQSIDEDSVARDLLLPGDLPGGAIRGVVETPDGQVFALAAQGLIFRLDLEGGERELVVDLGAATRSLAAAPDGSLWTALPDMGVFRVDPGAGTAALVRPADSSFRPLAVAVAPNGLTPPPARALPPALHLEGKWRFQVEGYETRKGSIASDVVLGRDSFLLSSDRGLALKGDLVELAPDGADLGLSLEYYSSGALRGWLGDRSIRHKGDGRRRTPYNVWFTSQSIELKRNHSGSKNRLVLHFDLAVRMKYQGKERTGSFSIEAKAPAGR